MSSPDSIVWKYEWKTFFCILPRKTISGNWIFMEKAFRRTVLICYFIPEPEYQYGTLFDVITNE